jgi:hypothetical protein
MTTPTRTKRLTCQVCAGIRAVTVEPSSGNIWLCPCGAINSLPVSLGDTYVNYMVPKSKPSRRHPLVTLAMVLASLAVAWLLAQDIRNSWQREQLFRARVAAQELRGHTAE